MTGAMRDPDEVRRDHVCACLGCDPSVVVMSARVGPQHVGVRFWEDNPEERDKYYNVAVLLDGVEISGVFEAVLGEEGTIWRYRGLPSPSSTGKHYCVTCLERGRRKIEENGGLYPSDGVPDWNLCQERLQGAVSLRVRPVTI